MNLDDFRKHLVWAEGWEQKPYTDSTGHLSIGCGRNLERGLTNAEIDYLLFNDMNHAVQQANELPYWKDLDAVRQLVVADCVFNLGLAGWMKFKKANEYLAIHDYEEAAAEMANSLWYRQVYRRAHKLVAAMQTGLWK